MSCYGVLVPLGTCQITVENKNHCILFVGDMAPKCVRMYVRPLCNCPVVFSEAVLEWIEDIMVVQVLPDVAG